MKSIYKPTKNKNFIGRAREIKYLSEITENDEASIILVHGRRRVGKTELIEQFFGNRQLLKFEGREDQAEDVQRKIFLESLSHYTGQSALSLLNLNTWREVLILLAEAVKRGPWTIFLEEFQWMSNYSTELTSELKFFWDNHFKHNPELILIICGSSPSFMIEKVVRSKALYNRSQHEIPLKPFNLNETKEFLGPRFTNLQALNVHLALGGFPEYLKRIKKEGALIPGLTKNSFQPGAFFRSEKERVFVSSMSSNPNYEKIVDILAKYRYLERSEILTMLNMSSGGASSDLIQDLIVSGFLEKYVSFQNKPNSSMGRYRIADNYLNYYYKFIAPKLTQIERGDYIDDPSRALNVRDFEQFLGYGFERFMLAESKRIAKHLGFAGVEYKVAPHYKRIKNREKEGAGLQLDLVFERADRVLTICEIKHKSKPTTINEADDIRAKFATLDYKPDYARQMVLVSTSGATKEVREAGIFDKIISLDDLFDK